MSKEATTMATTVNRDKHTRSRNQQTTIFINVDQHPRLQRCEAPAISLTAPPQHNLDNMTIIIYCHITRSDDNNRQMLGKNVTTPMRNNQMFMLSFAGCDNNHTMPCDDQRLKYAEVKYSECAKDGVYIAKGMYVTKGKYIEYAKRRVHCRRWVWWVRQGGRIHRGGPQQASRQRRQQLTPCWGWLLGWVQQRAPRHKGNWPHTPCKTTISLLPQRASGPCTPCKAMTSPLPQRVVGPQPLMIVNAPKHPW